MVFWGFAFEVLVLLWFAFGVFGIVPGVLKMFVFFSPVFWAWGGLFLLILGLEGLCVFVFLVFVFVFCVAFVSVSFALFLFSCWIVFGVGSCFFFFFFCCFCFLFFVGGFKGQVTWPKGPPHLALNPPYFFVFVFCYFCFLGRV